MSETVGARITQVTCPDCGGTVAIDSGDLTGVRLESLADLIATAQEAARPACPRHESSARIGHFSA